jgi:hypothetical protein
MLRNEAYTEVRRNDEDISVTKQVNFFRSHQWEGKIWQLMLH